MVGAFWVLSDLVNTYHMGQNVPTAIHSFEQLRNGVPREMKYGERILRECYKQAQWNEFVHVSIHLESSWCHDEALALLKDWLMLCREMGVQVVTETEFSQWFRRNYRSTPTQVWYFTDVLADRPTVLRGKKHAYADMVFYGSQKRRTIFSEDRGTLPVEIIRYDLRLPDKPSEPYPAIDLPEVQVRRMKVQSGDRLEITTELESRSALEEYAIVAWGLGLPERLEVEDIKSSKNVRFLKILHGVGAIVIGFDLKRGSNLIAISRR
jgi:hypothetical protein